MPSFSKIFLTSAFLTAIVASPVPQGSQGNNTELALEFGCPYIISTNGELPLPGYFPSDVGGLVLDLPPLPIIDFDLALGNYTSPQRLGLCEGRGFE
jgi:hypothetical protein